MSHTLTVRQQVHLLLLRAGAPPSKAELDAAEQAGVDATLAALLAPEHVDDSGLDTLVGSLATTLTPSADYDYSPLVRLFYLQLAFSARPLLYKMALFLL